MKKLFSTALLLFFIIESASLFAQTISDNQLWTGASIGLKLNKKFTISLREEYRFGNNISTKTQDFTGLGVKYKINKHFSLASKFRFIDVPIKKNKRRFSLDVNYSWKKKDFPVSFKYRFRIQDTKKFNSKKQGSDYLRNKFTIAYNASKLVDPYLAFELYYRFDGKNEFRKNRFTLGLDWKINKKMSLATFYRLQKDMNVKTPVKLKIIGVAFAFNLSIKDLKKKTN